MRGRGAIVVLRAGELHLAVEAASIRQIVEAPPLTLPPLARRELAGVLAHEGRAVPVYHLARVVRGAEPARRADRPGQIAIVEHDGALVGFLVEKSESVPGGAAAPPNVLDARALVTAAGVFEGASGGDPAARAEEGES